MIEEEETKQSNKEERYNIDRLNENLFILSNEKKDNDNIIKNIENKKQQKKIKVFQLKIKHKRNK